MGGARVLNIGQSGSHASERQKSATFAAMELSRLRDSIQQKFNGLQKDLSHIIEEAIVDITVMEATERTSLEMTKASMAVSGMCMSTPLPDPVRLVPPAARGKDATTKSVAATGSSIGIDAIVEESSPGHCPSRWQSGQHWHPSQKCVEALQVSRV